MPSGTFTDFVKQMPDDLIRLFFIFIVLIIMSVVGYILFKRREARAAKTTAPKPSNSGSLLSGLLSGLFSGSTAQAAPPRAPRTTDDIPDIDTLLAMTDPATTPNTAPPPEPRRAGLVDVQLSDGTTVEAAEMLILLRDRTTNKLIVQISEHAYTGAEGQIDVDFRRRFVALMKELSGVAPNLTRGGKKQAAPAAPATPPHPAEAEATPTTLADQLEQRLQAKRRATGAFAGRAIHISDAPDGGVQIEVDGAHYDGVEAIEDPAVKALITEVVAEWQANQ